MDEAMTAAATMLVGGPVVGVVAMSADLAMWRVWTASREEHLAIVRAHRRGWSLANAGFVVATLSSAAGLALLAMGLTGDPSRTAALAAVAVCYAMAGVLWIAIQGIRLRTTPALADLVAGGAATEPAEGLLGAAVGGMFTAFTLVTAGSLIGLGGILAALGGVALPIALVVAGIGALVTVLQLRNGDSIPAVLYLPTILVGIAILLGWT